MQTNTNNSESSKDLNNIPTPPADTETDDLGYDIPKDPAAPPVPPTPPASVADKDKVEKPVTGYGAPPVVETPPAPPAPPVPPKDEAALTDAEKEQKEIADLITTLPDSFDKEKISKFAVENKLTKDQATAYAKLLKEDHAAQEKSAKEFAATKKLEWYNELKNDPDFGGENFDRNVHQAESILQNHMPNMKKMLTERGSTVPPYIMRDLSALYKVLNPVASFDNGQPPGTDDSGDNFLDEMYR